MGRINLLLYHHHIECMTSSSSLQGKYVQTLPLRLQMPRGLPSPGQTASVLANHSEVSIRNLGERFGGNGESEKRDRIKGDLPIRCSLRNSMPHLWTKCNGRAPAVNQIPFGLHPRGCIANTTENSSPFAAATLCRPQASVGRFGCASPLRGLPSPRPFLQSNFLLLGPPSDF